MNRSNFKVKANLLLIVVITWHVVMAVLFYGSDTKGRICGLLVLCIAWSTPFYVRHKVKPYLPSKDYTTVCKELSNLCEKLGLSNNWKDPITGKSYGFEFVKNHLFISVIDVFREYNGETLRSDDYLLVQTYVVSLKINKAVFRYYDLGVVEYISSSGHVNFDPKTNSTVKLPADTNVVSEAELIELYDELTASVT